MASLPHPTQSNSWTRDGGTGFPIDGGGPRGRPAAARACASDGRPRSRRARRPPRPLRGAPCAQSQRYHLQALLPPSLTPARRPPQAADAAASTSAAAAAAAAAPAAQAGLVLGPGAPGAWDEAALGHPVVRFYLGDDEQRWFLWYSGRAAADADVDALFPASGSAGLAVSADGACWARGGGDVAGARGAGRAADVGRVLAPNADWWWHDTRHLHVSDVQILSAGGAGEAGVYWAFYSGGSFEEDALPPALAAVAGVSSDGGGAAATPGARLRPGLAMSQDGRNFARIEAEHHSGALFDAGAPDEWDAAFVGAPQVVAAGPRDMRMFYHSYDCANERYVVGLATSADGFKWEKRGPVFDPGAGAAPGAHDARGAGARCVVRDAASRRFFMFYEAVAADGGRSVGLAVSDDGLREWRRHDAPVLEASAAPGAWDGGGVGTPWAVSMAGGRWRLYYAGRAGAAGAWRGIGLALSEDGGEFMGAPTRFRRRTGSADAAAE